MTDKGAALIAKAIAFLGMAIFRGMLVSAPRLYCGNVQKGIDSTESEYNRLWQEGTR